MNAGLLVFRGVSFKEGHLLRKKLRDDEGSCSSFKRVEVPTEKKTTKHRHSLKKKRNNHLCQWEYTREHLRNSFFIPFGNIRLLYFVHPSVSVASTIQHLRRSSPKKKFFFQSATEVSNDWTTEPTIFDWTTFARTFRLGLVVKWEYQLFIL